MAEIRKVAVLGAGLMGSQIAAHVANAGVPVLLLDVEAPKAALDRLAKADPAPFMHPSAARLITVGAFATDLGGLAEVDWIIEAVIENVDIKRELYAKVDAARKPGSIVSSNTSTIPLATLLAGMSEAFVADFLVTHFFNPPRYMRLLEVVAGPATRAAALDSVVDFADTRLGKGVVLCHDRPGFIANRVGTYWLQCAISEAMARGLMIEEVDAVLSRPIGVPKTGVFGLVDLVGIDLIPLVGRSLAERLAPEDDYLRIHAESPLIADMIARGYTGRKGKGGFYRLNQTGGEKVKEAIDLATGEYRTAIKPSLDAVTAAGRDLRALFQHPDRIGAYARAVLAQTLGYAAALVPEIADDVTAVDEAMRLGYNWTQGPFELIDRIGADVLADALVEMGRPVPRLLDIARGRKFYRVEGARLEYLTVTGDYAPVTRRPGVQLLADAKRGREPLMKNGSASLWDVGDGVACFEFTTKMNTIDGDLLQMLGKSIEFVGKEVAAGRLKGLVIYNEGTNFSAGANLGLALFALNIALWPAVEDLVATGQTVYQALKYAPFPTVAAPAGMALGGGCEILLHCSAIQAHAESYIGLVEVGVGLIPGWGGTKELIGRWAADHALPSGPMPAVLKAFETIGTAQVSRSAALARDLHYLTPRDGVTMNRDRLLADAKARVLDLASDYRAPEPYALRLPGPSGRAAMVMAVEGMALSGRATPHDVTVSKALAGVLSGGEADHVDVTTEKQMLALERAAFIALAKDPNSIARVEHMLETGKPLRN